MPYKVHTKDGNPYCVEKLNGKDVGCSDKEHIGAYLGKLNSVAENEIFDIQKGKSYSRIDQTTTLGLQVRFVDAQSGEVIVGSGLGEAVTVKESTMLGDIDEVKFNQSTIGITTKKSLETASSRIVSKLIKKGVFPQ